jgi:hypothetical protein
MPVRIPVPQPHEIVVGLAGFARVIEQTAQAGEVEEFRVIPKWLSVSAGSSL